MRPEREVSNHPIKAQIMEAAENMFVIMCEHGDYSDRTVWVVGICRTEEHAKSVVLDLDRSNMEAHAEFEKWRKETGEALLEKWRDLKVKSGYAYPNPEADSLYNQYTAKEREIAAKYKLARSHLDGENSFFFEETRIIR